MNLRDAAKSYLKGIEFVAAVQAAVDSEDKSGLPSGWEIEVSGMNYICLKFHEFMYSGRAVAQGVEMESVADAVRRLFKAYRAECETWEEVGRISLSAQHQVSAWSMEYEHSPISVYMDGKAGVCVSATGVPSLSLSGKFALEAMRLGAHEVSVRSRIGRAVMAWWQPETVNEAGEFLGKLAKLLVEEECDLCDGNGRCRTCQGEGCSSCGGNECELCDGGKRLVWKE